MGLRTARVIEDEDEVSSTHLTPIKIKQESVQTLKTFHSADDNIDRITVYSAQRLEPGVELHISVTDTPGYTQPNSQKWLRTIKREFSRRFNLQKESRQNVHQQKLFGMHEEKNTPRTHARKESRHRHKGSLPKHSFGEEHHLIDLTLFMFTNPVLHEFECDLLRKVSEHSNILPIWGKGDCLSPLGLKELKAMFMSNTKEARIEWFDISGTLRTPHPHKLIQLVSAPMGPCPPFVVANPNRPTATERIKARKGFWGEFDLENPEHSDFLLLYNLLIGYLCFPLKERTEALFDKQVRSGSAVSPMYDPQLLDQLPHRETQTGLYASDMSAKKPMNQDVENAGKFVMDFSLGMAMGMGIIGAITFLAKKTSIL